MGKKRNKFFANKAVYEGELFDSTAEIIVWKQCQFRLMTGAIRDLKRQVKIECRVYGEKVCDYVCDIVYFDVAQNKTVYVDVKSVITAKLPVYRLKKRLVKACHRIDIQEFIV